MPRKTKPIPVNQFGDGSAAGISIERFSFEDLPDLGVWQQPERHDRHSFFLVYTGSVSIEIDFARHRIVSPAVVYMHPDQVHRIIAFEKISACALAVRDDVLNAEYLRILEELNPAAPIHLDPETFGLLSETAALTISISARNKDNLYNLLLKNQANALVGLIIATYTAQTNPTDQLSRAESVTKTFRADLARHFAVLKRPADYARKQNLSTAYLNECVKSTTGQALSYHIQQRVVLEAKRLLYHSDQSLKEIAAVLGYDDYSYFSRLFSKIAGMPPVSFRHKTAISPSLSPIQPMDTDFPIVPL